MQAQSLQLWARLLRPCLARPAKAHHGGHYGGPAGQQGYTERVRGETPLCIASSLLLSSLATTEAKKSLKQRALVGLESPRSRQISSPSFSCDPANPRAERCAHGNRRAAISRFSRFCPANSKAILSASGASWDLVFLRQVARACKSKSGIPWGQARSATAAIRSKELLFLACFQVALFARAVSATRPGSQEQAKCTTNRKRPSLWLSWSLQLSRHTTPSDGDGDGIPGQKI